MFQSTRLHVSESLYVSLRGGDVAGGECFGLSWRQGPKGDKMRDKIIILNKKKHFLLSTNFKLLS
jgi:hypothetical protein